MTKLSPSLSFVFSLLLFFLGCQNQDNQERQQSNDKLKARSEPAREFNTSDKSTESNNNVHIAFERLANSTQEQIWQSAQPISPTTLLKNPYSFIGKLFKVTGSAYHVTDLPPIENLSGRWGQVLMSAGTPDSPSGKITVEFIYRDDIEETHEHDEITCAGYFVGTGKNVSESDEEVEVIVIVGNVIRKGD